MKSIIITLGLVALLSISAQCQETKEEWENRLTGNWDVIAKRSKESRSIATVKTHQQWVLASQRESMGQSCIDGLMFTFSSDSQKVQVRECINNAWKSKVYKWEVHLPADSDPEIRLKNGPTYFMRFVTKDGEEQLRLTKQGASPAEPTIHYYLK